MIGKINDNYVFLRTLEDIREKIIGFDEYKIIRAAGLIRHLILEEQLLIDKVNKKPFKTSILFAMEDNKPKLNLKNIDFENINILPRNKIIKTELRLFLSTPILLSKSEIYTVKDIIKSVTTFWGGIHSYNIENAKDLILKGTDKQVFIDYYMVLVCVQQICTITLDALKQLEIKIRAVETRI